MHGSTCVEGTRMAQNMHALTHKNVLTESIALHYTYRIRGNFQGSYISRITCQEGFRILIFADDLPLHHYYYYHGLLIEIFED